LVAQEMRNQLLGVAGYPGSLMNSRPGIDRHRKT
jgi:hypothetical protein